MKIKFLFIFASFVVCNTFAAHHYTESATEKYFESVKNNPEQLHQFLNDMPKGGDLHMHLSGASWAENMIHYGKDDQLCVNEYRYNVYPNPVCADEYRLETVQNHPELYNAIIDAWSMRNFVAGKESGHDHFFATFGKFKAISDNHTGELLSEVAERAGEQNELYLEIMTTPDKNHSGVLGKKVGWDPDFNAMRNKLFVAGLLDIVKEMSANLTVDEHILDSTLHCGTDQAMPGCKVKIRYLYQVLRGQPPEQVFAQLLAGFEAARTEPRIVGINMVQPEDNKTSMRDYSLQMQMIGYLHQVYPDVHISLHAGELVPGLVSSDGLRFHIRQAVEVANAERIGHGVDITHEDDYQKLLQEMSQKHVMVEINLSSNAAILNVVGPDEPIELYMKNAVPVALSTDDEGVSRSTLTMEYQRAVNTYQFNYPTLKNFSRNSLFYSFIPGRNLWNDYQYQQRVPDCANDKLVKAKISASCQKFLNENEKANAQWQLEKKFAEFEQKYSLMLY